MFHVEKGLGQIVLRIEVDQQRPATKAGLPGAEHLTGNCGFADTSNFHPMGNSRLWRAGNLAASF